MVDQKALKAAEAAFLNSTEFTREVRLGLAIEAYQAALPPPPPGQMGTVIDDGVLWHKEAMTNWPPDGTAVYFVRPAAGDVVDLIRWLKSCASVQELTIGKERLLSIADAIATLSAAMRRSERDWPEDFAHENGQYSNQCCKCRETFTGHKRRVICRSCAIVPRSHQDAE